LVDNEKYYDILGYDGESSGFITSKGKIALPGDRSIHKYEGWNFNNDNYLFTTDTK